MLPMRTLARMSVSFFHECHCSSFVSSAAGHCRACIYIYIYINAEGLPEHWVNPPLPTLFGPGLQSCFPPPRAASQRLWTAQESPQGAPKRPWNRQGVRGAWGRFPCLPWSDRPSGASWEASLEPSEGHGVEASGTHFLGSGTHF